MHITPVYLNQYWYRFRCNFSSNWMNWIDIWGMGCTPPVKCVSVTLPGSINQPIYILLIGMEYQIAIWCSAKGHSTLIVMWSYWLIPLREADRNTNLWRVWWTSGNNKTQSLSEHWPLLSDSSGFGLQVHVIKRSIICLCGIANIEIYTNGVQCRWNWSQNKNKDATNLLQYIAGLFAAKVNRCHRHDS